MKDDNSSRLAKIGMTLGLVQSISHVKIQYLQAFLVSNKTSWILCTENESLIKTLISFEKSDHFYGKMKQENRQSEITETSLRKRVTLMEDRKREVWKWLNTENESMRLK